MPPSIKGDHQLVRCGGALTTMREERFPVVFNTIRTVQTTRILADKTTFHDFIAGCDVRYFPASSSVVFVISDAFDISNQYIITSRRRLRLVYFNPSESIGGAHGFCDKISMISLLELISRRHGGSPRAIS
jgi:hypothetical protein